jgi:MFS family permease
MSAWPTVAEERAMAMRHRFSDVKAIVSGISTPWQSNSTIISLVFFGLTIFVIAAFFGLLVLFQLPKGWITSIISLGIAELLIQRRKMFGTGIESALWIGGLFAFIFGLPSEGKPEALLVFGAAAALAGVRVRNPYFGALAAILIVVYPAVNTHGHNFWSGGAALLALAIAMAAAIALLRTWQRPSNQAIFETLVVVMPAVAYIIGFVLDVWTTHSNHEPSIAIVFGVLAAVLLILGIRTRQHALLIAGGVTAACFGVEMHELFEFVSEEARLIASGVLLVAIGFAITRALRGRTTGIVVTATPKSFIEEAIQIAGSVGIAHPEHVESQPEVQTGGGGFGGGGASGGY